MSETEVVECAKNTQFISTRVQMERQNSDYVGDIKTFAFIKSGKTTSEEKKETP